MQKNRRTAPARQATTKSPPPRIQPAKRQQPARRSEYPGSGTEVVDQVSIAKAQQLGLTAERLRWVANWHDRFDANRHFLIAKRLRQIADGLAAANDNGAVRRAA